MKNPEDASPTMPQTGISAPRLVADRKSTSDSVAVAPRQLGEDGSVGILRGKNRPPQNDKAQAVWQKVSLDSTTERQEEIDPRLTLFLRRA